MQSVCRKVVIVGHGMVGHRLCEELRKHSELDATEVVVFGDEVRGAYDRVHLADVVRGAPADRLALGAPDFYEKSRIEVVSGDRVVKIDRAQKRVIAASGRTEPYDHLVLCTGAFPVTAGLPGMDDPAVRPLRSLEDALLIRKRAVQAREAGSSVVIIGGGLLGLELASELVGLGCEVDVLEGADYPLSRQLESGAGEALRRSLRLPGLRLSVGCRVSGIRRTADRVSVDLADGRTFGATLVVPAMGIRARDQLAKEAGLPCDLFGGIEVNDLLLTKDKSISAVGECARHRGVVYGLVAPGYAMAEQVARRLAGKSARFRGVHVGTRLKVEGIELSVLGESSATGLGVKSVVTSDGGAYRRLAVRRGKIIGITSIGPWSELVRAQDALARAETFRPVHLRRFQRSEPVWPDQKISLHVWPDDATVCTCMGVTCGTLKELAKGAGTTVEQLCSLSGAGTVCGTCKPLLATLTEEPPQKQVDARIMLAVSLLSMLGAVAFYFAPPVEVSSTVQSPGLSFLWNDKLVRQATGFFSLFLFSTSIVLSARKRLRSFSLGDFELWRIAHGLVGILCLLGAFLHTGFRKGQGLDHALLLVVLASIFLGGIAGGYQMLLGSVAKEHAQVLRAWLVRSHIYLLWPLPVLLAFHIVKVYFF